MKINKNGFGSLGPGGLSMAITGDTCFRGGEKLNSQLIRWTKGWGDLCLQYYEFYDR